MSEIEKRIERTRKGIAARLRRRYRYGRDCGLSAQEAREIRHMSLKRIESVIKEHKGK